MRNASELGWLVSIVTRLWAGRAVVRIPIWVRDFSHPQKRPDTLWGPPTLLFNENRGPFWRIKRQGRDDAYFSLRARLRISVIILLLRGPGSVVGIATAYGLDGPGIESWWGEIFRTSPDRPWGPPSLLYNGYRVFPGGKVLPGRDADPSPPSSAEV